MGRRLRVLMGSLSRERQVIALAFGALAIFGVLKLLFRLPVPIFDLQVPEYGAVLGLGLIAVGLFLPDPRGLFATAFGGFLAAVSGVALLMLSTERWDVIIYGLPLALLAGTGLGVFCHSVLHGQPTLARAGMTAVLYGFAGALVLYGALWLRATVKGEDATRFIAVVTVVAIAVTAVTVATAARGPARKRARD